MPTIPFPRLALSANTELPAQHLGWTAYQSALNVDLTQGVIRKRGGFAQWLAGLTGIPMGVWTYVTAQGRSWTIIATTQRLYSYDMAGQTLADRTPAGYTAGLDIPAALAVLNGIAVLTNGRGLWWWDGQAATFAVMPAGSPQAGRDLCAFGNHLLLAHPTLADGTVDPFGLLWSDYLNPTVWTTGDAGTIDIPDGGDPVMAVRLYGQAALLWKSDSIYQISTVQAPLFYALSRVADFTGTIAQATVRELPGIGYAFLGRNDVYVFAGLAVPAPLLGPRGETLRRTISAALNLAYAGAAFAVSDINLRRYVLFIPTAGFTLAQPLYRSVVFNWADQTWAEWDLATLPGGVCGGGEGTQTFLGQVAPQLVFGGVAPPALYYQPTPPIGIDAGGAFRSYVTTGLSDLSGGDAQAVYARHKTMRRCAITSSADSLGGLFVSVLASENGVSTREIGPLSVMLQGPLPATVWPDVTAAWFALRFDDQAQGRPFELQSAWIDIEIAGDR
jgi:hypothetical protein